MENLLLKKLQIKAGFEVSVINAPDYLLAELKKNPLALDFYDQLAYSHRKEYVLWIISAKQEKTKKERITKMIEKLLEKKKNPTEK